MWNKFLLKFVALFNPIYRTMGADPEQLQIILATKLLVDDRTPSSLSKFRQRRSSKAPAVFRSIMMVMYGFFLIGLLFISPHPFTSHTLLFIVFMVLLISTLVSDFTNVLFDVRDNYFILPRPVNNRTISLVRTLHILLHLSKMILPMSIPPLLAEFIVGGFFPGLMLIVEILAASILSVFTVNFLYLLILQFMKPSKFRDIIAYFQVGFMILIFGGYYTIPQFIDLKTLNSFSFSSHPISFLLPPFWIAGLHEWAVGNVNHVVLICSALAIATPLIGMGIITTWLSRGFTNKLAQIGASSEEDDQIVKTRGSEKQQSFMGRLSSTFCKTSLERAGFEFTWRLTSRLREFKVRTYPSFAFIPIYFIYFVLRRKQGETFSEKWAALPHTHAYLFVLYLTSFLSLILVQNVMRSQKCYAAWIFNISPGKRPGDILIGMVKSIWLKFYVPVMLILLAFVFSVWGIAVVWNVILAVINIFTISMALFLILARSFPFSQPVNINQEMGKVFFNLIVLLIPLGMGFGHYLISGYPLVIGIFSTLSLVAGLLMFNAYKHISWAKISA